MCTTHLHLLAGYGPDRSIQVEFGPLGRAQLPWPDEHMWRHPQGYSDCGLTFISLNGAEQLADLGGFDDRRVVLHLGSDQGALDRKSGVWGKRVYVRIEHGGSRINKQK